jgi:PhnB protein
MIKVETYLIFDGTCADALRFYERTLGGTLRMMTAAESPAAGQMPPGSGDKILHAHLDVDGGVLMASDSMTGQPYQGMGGFVVSLTYPSAADARRIFEALSEGGRTTMPLGKTFWVEMFGMLIDRFGTPWMVSGGAPTA